MSKPAPTPAKSESQSKRPPTAPPPALAVSAGDLDFVLQVLVPRVWVRGPEVEALVEVRQKFAAILEEVGRDAHA